MSTNLIESSYSNNKKKQHKSHKQYNKDMKYRHTLAEYARKYGVSRASRKYHKSRSYIYFRLARYEGAIPGPPFAPFPSLPSSAIQRFALRGLWGKRPLWGEGWLLAPAGVPGRPTQRKGRIRRA